MHSSEGLYGGPESALPENIALLTERQSEIDRALEDLTADIERLRADPETATNDLKVLLGQRDELIRQKDDVALAKMRATHTNHP